MAMLRYNALLNPRPRDGGMELLLQRRFSPEKEKPLVPARQMCSCSNLCFFFLSVIGSSSIIAYAIFQNAVRSPEVRSEPPFLSRSRGVGTLQMGHARSKDPCGSGTLRGATAGLGLMWLKLV